MSEWNITPMDELQQAVVKVKHARKAVETHEDAFRDLSIKCKFYDYNSSHGHTCTSDQMVNVNYPFCVAQNCPVGAGTQEI